MPVRRVTIAGFRGILAPLTIDLAPGGRPLSLVLYGRNGTGKSSVVDAWEWFWSARVENLAREGAGPSSYSHRESVNGDTYVEVEFMAPELGSIRQIFHHDRPSIPTTIGALELFRSITPHPCHIRFGDLTRFVYLRKAERYDLLSTLMGFSRQVEVQKALRRVGRLVETEVSALRDRLKQVAKTLRAAVPVEDLSESGLLAKANPMLTQHDLAPAASLRELTVASERLNTLVRRDRLSDLLARLTALGRQVKIAKAPESVPAPVAHYVATVQAFKEQEETLRELLLIDLYTKGLEVISVRGNSNQCPLCGQHFEGDLSKHIEDELVPLRGLQTLHAAAEEARTGAAQSLHESYDGAPIREALRKIDVPDAEARAETVVAALELADARRSQLLSQLDIRSEELDNSAVAKLRASEEMLDASLRDFSSSRRELLQFLAGEVRRLRADAARLRLVDDAQRLAAMLAAWDQYLTIVAEGIELKRVGDQFDQVVTAFVEASTIDVNARFEAISGKVADYFAILEEHTPGIERPVLKLLVDQDRAVIPEVTFHGTEVSPAYRYLSESQLCSFGLSVFLASVRHFNPEFRLLILDDVINSLDGYKRPQVIKLLKEHFGDYQILLTTHDSAWRDRLYKALPSWRRIEFSRIDYGIGPVSREGLRSLDEISQFIHDDKATLAGQSLGPYIERELQDVCEAFEVELKYNRRNEYTLDPLLDRLRVRVQQKLGTNHELTLALAALYEESGFRNLSAHAKDPAIALTPEEMTGAIEKWVRVEKLVRCQHDRCAAVLRYTSPDLFRCPCGKSALERVKPI